MKAKAFFSVLASMIFGFIIWKIGFNLYGGNRVEVPEKVYLITSLAPLPSSVRMAVQSVNSALGLSLAPAPPSGPQSNEILFMKEPALVRAIRRKLIPPSKKPYNFAVLKNFKPGANPSAGQVQAVEDILENFAQPGFYVECGANNGERTSNSLWLEKARGWEGLLVEADPVNFQRLKARHRKAWLGGFCLSDSASAKNGSFYIQSQRKSRLGSGLIRSRNYGALAPVTVECYPLYSVLLALNRTTVDFLSLDVEGSEMDILRTIPFDRVFIKVITVEHLTLKEGKLGLRKFLESKGYLFYRTVVTPKYTAGDSIFLHKSLPLTDIQRRRIGVEDSDVTRLPR